MKGIPTYTQLTVAFPTSPLGHHVIEDINVSFLAKGGGTWGEFSFKWLDFGPNYLGDKRDHRALKVVAFTDGMNAMLDSRILPILTKLSKRSRDLPEVTPEWLIKKLEAAGVQPSTYQLEGVYGSIYGGTDYWPGEARLLYEGQKRYEEGLPLLPKHKFRRAA